MECQKKRGEIDVDRSFREIRAHGTADFPCAVYSSVHDKGMMDAIDWHWHEEFEIMYAAEGEFDVRTASGAYKLKEGECLAVNSNMLHFASSCGHAQLKSIVFSMKIPGGSDDSVFSLKYIKPLAECGGFSAWKTQATDFSLTRLFLNVFSKMEQKPFGYEFAVRADLSEICLLLYRKFENQICSGEQGKNTEEKRIRVMLEFIHKNYKNSVSLADIARTADIGERECLRCFQKTIQMSPVQYLLKYRIMRGAELLREDPASSIAQIALSCGFDSPSNFAKLFKRFYKQTPREYRNG